MKPKTGTVIIFILILTLGLLIAGMVWWRSVMETNREARVKSRLELVQALSQAEPGSTILVEPGVYEGGIYIENLRGEPGKPIVIAAADPSDPPVIRGGREGLHLVDPAYVEIYNLTFVGASYNGVNIDDGGSYDTPAHHIVLQGLTVMDIGPEGNRDGIKLSGVDDFVVRNCVVERWGTEGSAIDMVGCHRGIIEGCIFRYEDDVGSSGVQVKGGSSDIIIRGNRFEHAGRRAVNIGGSTDLQYFRPQPPPGYEAKNITVEGNVFIGSNAPIAFVGVDGAVVRFNTIYCPKLWVVRILQETTEPGFIPCRNGRFTDNIVVFESHETSTTVNVGPGTLPRTFVFARNFWYALDDPLLSHPSLPVDEVDGVYGLDPMFVDPEKGDFRLKPGSPAEGKGAYALSDEESSP